jgi:hypothetical protein
MARSGQEQAAVQRANALVATEVIGGGGSATIRVAVRHTDDDHPSSATFHYGPAFNEAFADVVAHVQGVAPGEVDLHEEALKTAERAREEYPESEGWEVSLEAIVPHEDNDGSDSDRSIVRRIEEG